MRVLITLIRRELSSFFSGLGGYLIIAAMLFLTGVSFVDIIEAVNNDTIHMPLTELFFGSPFFWLILLVVPTPVITMRLFALEKFSGTYETLMTTPVGDVQVVLAKFAAAWMFFAVAIAPLLGVLQLVHHYASPGERFEWWTTASTFGGILLIGSSYLAMGCLASALTRSQIVAATMSFGAGLALFLFSFLQFSIGTQPGCLAKVVNHVSLFGHMEDFVRGVVDTRPLVFHLSLVAFVLFLNVKVVESRRWK